MKKNVKRQLEGKWSCCGQGWERGNNASNRRRSSFKVSQGPEDRNGLEENEIYWNSYFQKKAEFPSEDGIEKAIPKRRLYLG